jgi:thioredoxin-related protein
MVAGVAFMRRWTTIAISLLLLLAAAAAQITFNPRLYDPDANARAEIAKAVREAERDHKRVLLVFGANWCPDCHALDFRFHQEPIKALVESNFVVVHVDTGEGEGRYAKNVEVAEQYQIPLKKGIPAIAVLSERGRLLSSQKDGQFSSARRLDPQQIVEFLNQWKPPKNST